MTSISVRDARPEDAKRIGEVARASWTETYRSIFEPAYIADFLERHYAERDLAEQARRAAASDDGHFLVAERDGELVAFAQYGVGPRGPQLFRIYADPGHFGAGAGHALLEALHGRIAGSVASYELDVHSRNERGRAFYDRNGFVIVGGGETLECDLTLRRTLRPARPRLPVETERLRLRPLEDADAERLHDIYGDAETMRFVGRSGSPRPTSRPPAARSPGCAATTTSTGSASGRSTSATASPSSVSPGCCGSRATGPRSRPPTSCAAIAGAGAMPPRRWARCCASAARSSGSSASWRCRTRRTGPRAG